MKRRNFIKSSGLIGGGLMLKFGNVGAGVQRVAASPLTVANSVAGAATVGNFLVISPNGDVVFHFVKHEMGQGVSTAMAQIISEELCADWSRVKVDFPVADMKKFNSDFGTGGSCTIQYQWDLLRQAGAAAREMLVQAAARQWNTAPENCIAENHIVFDRTTKRTLGFGQLAAAAAKLPVPKDAKLKEPKEYKIIGQRKKALLAPDIVTGSLQYGIDVKLPGLHYAVIERCPVFKGKIKSFDASGALKVPSVKKVFTTQPIAGLQRLTPWMPHDVREGVVVVADSFWAAQKGREALVIEWDEGVNAKYNSSDFEELAQQRAIHRTDPTGYVGDENAVSDLGHVRKTIRASYVFPHQLHSCMEPLNCTAYANDNGVEIWMGSQAPDLIITELARNYKWKQEDIKVHLFPSGGGFGRRYYPDVANEATFISKTAGNIPVKMIWTREDDHKANLANMFQHLEYQAALDKDDKLYAWYEKEIRTYTWAAKYADPQLPTMAYEIPNIRYDLEDMIADELVHSSAWRGVIMHGKSYSECFIDEIAADQKKDPYQFRLSMLTKDRLIYSGSEGHISSARLRAVLVLAAEKAGWGKPLGPGKGMGIAVVPYGINYCASVAEITVQNGKMTIDKMTVAVDCGRVINPLGVENSIAGGIVWSLTALFHGGMPIRNGRHIHTNFHQNKILRMNECPPIGVHIIDSQEAPGGIGEISSNMGVPAVLNAIFAATGKRIRKVPISLEDIIPG